MQLVERHIISPSHSLFEECDRLAFLAKNLYNQALYRQRQSFFETGKTLGAFVLQKQFQDENHIDYRALPAKVSQQTLRVLDKNWKSYFKAIKAYRKDPTKFKKKPKPPKYKNKTKGRSVVVYEKQTISKRALRKGLIKLSGTTIELEKKVDNIQQVRIVNRYGRYVIEVIYNKETPKIKETGNIAAIDLGLVNLATVTFSHNKQPIIINGNPVKSINQYFNKKKSKLMSFVGNKGTSNRLKKLNLKRDNKVTDYLHKSSRYIINHLVSLNVSTLVIGWNKDMKQDINIGRKNNQKFVCVPFLKFISQLSYKAELEGIKVIVREESYTSKCSFLDLEPICKHKNYKGKRVKRGLFKSANGILINADVNASYNIMRKEFQNVVPNVFSEGIEGVAVRPLMVSVKDN